MCAGVGIDEWFPIQYKGKQSGQVHLKSVWKPAVAGGAKPAAAQAPGYGMQQPSAMGMAGAMGGMGGMGAMS